MLDVVLEEIYELFCLYNVMMESCSQLSYIEKVCLLDKILRWIAIVGWILQAKSSGPTELIWWISTVGFWLY